MINIQVFSSRRLYSWRESWKTKQRRFLPPIIKGRNKGKRKGFLLGQGLSTQRENYIGRPQESIWPWGASISKVGRGKTWKREGTAWGKTWAGVHRVTFRKKKAEVWLGSVVQLGTGERKKVTARSRTSLTSLEGMPLMSWILSYRQWEAI